MATNIWPCSQSTIYYAHLAAVDALSSCAIAKLEVATLHHEPLDDSMEDGVLVVQRLVGVVPDAFLPSAQGAEVLARQGALFWEQLEDDPASWCDSAASTQDEHVSSNGLAVASNSDTRAGTALHN